MNGTAGALRVSAQDRNQFVAAIEIVFDAIGRLGRQFDAALRTGILFKRCAECLPGVARPVVAEGMDFRARHLEYADFVLMATLQKREIHCRGTRRTVIAYVLIQDALDHRDESAASRIDWPASDQLLEYSC